MTPSPQMLVDAAIAAAAGAYAPYSGFRVGAALLLTDGRVVTGANMENASYGLSLCAETVALAKAANDGALGEVTALAVAGGAVVDASAGGIVMPGTDPVAPCGRCRQLLHEAASLGARDIPVYCAHAAGYETVMLSTLLPFAFGPESLTR